MSAYLFAPVVVKSIVAVIDVRNVGVPAVVVKSEYPPVMSILVLGVTALFVIKSPCSKPFPGDATIPEIARAIAEVTNSVDADRLLEFPAGGVATMEFGPGGKSIR